MRASALPRPTEPLPNTLTTGRHSTLGHTGCPTLRVPIGIHPRVSTAAKLTATTSRAGSTSSARSTTLRSSSVANKTIAAPTARTSNMARAVPVPSRPPSEVASLKSEITKLKEELKTREEQLKLTSEVLEMQKTNLTHINAQLENAKIRLDLVESCKITLEEQLKLLKENMQQKTAHNEEMCQQLNEKEAILRKLHNDVVDMRGQIRVAVRVRPMLKSEEESSNDGIEYPAVNAIAINQGTKKGTTLMFEKSALHGYNVGLIAFGQTGSGKTHTMRGGDAEEEEGIIPRAATFLFRESKKLEATGWKFEFSLSFLEIYNNEAYDLLNNHAAVKLRLVNQTVTLDGLSDHPLAKQSEIGSLLRTADKNRKTAATKCNEYSSRSHAIYMWKIKAHQQATGISTSSMLKLVDLAGSERAKESGVIGQQFKEMTNINQSLSVLQKCISLQKSKSQHIPYRDSKLTQVLMDCLGAGNSKTMVVVNINPCNDQATESKRSIEFASKMRDTHIGSAVQQRDLY
ncbi:hypothetical protein GCK72_002545 [Caenorhabditis remanei]|uniref:Kinesin-like protein n=1 Tax=Caenorhabditis remanei TaxID=31234 RepID=A0A6A5HWI5_CAERE|nr:hypothetical protein GCK72_002545 [Caenorhabditis remanei]KAF1770723.1 hypothetical protein GCK72_002545 [Caenorhabditis remanei]